MDTKFILSSTGEKYVVIATNTSSFRLYNMETKVNRYIHGHKDIIMCIAVKQKYILTGAKDNNLKIWEFEEKQDGTCDLRLRCTFKGHVENVTNCVFSNSEFMDYFYSVSADKSVKKWNIPEAIFESEKPKIMKSAL
jgi:WD40 repeat protein